MALHDQLPDDLRLKAKDVQKFTIEQEYELQRRQNRRMGLPQDPEEA